VVKPAVTSDKRLDGKPLSSSGWEGEASRATSKPEDLLFVLIKSEIV
jgi:hypothetical protein